MFWLVEQYGNIGIAILLILEFIGLPVPGEPLMTFLGFVTNRNNDSLMLALVFAIIGTNVGSIIAYFLGKRFGDPLLHKYGKYFFIDELKIQETKNIMLKYEISILLFSRYIIGVRHVVPYLCGIMKLPFAKYNLYSFIGSVIWCTSFVATGYFLGSKWVMAAEIIEKYAAIGIIIGLVIVTVVKVIRIIKFKK